MNKIISKEEFSEMLRKEQERRKEEKIAYEKAKYLDYLAFERHSIKRKSWANKRAI